MVFKRTHNFKVLKSQLTMTLC